MASFDYDELLIEEVRKHENLWRIKAKSFKDIEMAKNSWYAIVKSFEEHGVKVEGNELRKKWKYLRDNYIREKKKQVNKSGDGASKLSKWKYWNQLSFLEDSTNSFCRETITFGVPDKENDESILSTEKASPITKPKSKKRKVDVVEDEILSCLKSFSKPKENASQYESFGQYLSNVLTQLPTNLAIQAKQEVQNTLFKYENMAYQQQEVASDDKFSSSYLNYLNN